MSESIDLVAQGEIYVLLNTISDVLTDKGCELPSEKAQKACQCAEKLIACIKSHLKHAKQKILPLIYSAISYELLYLQKRCEMPYFKRMWENYCKLCSSEEFRKRWVSIVQDFTGFNPSPIFYMFVTDTIMKLVIKKIFPVTDDESGNTVSSLEYHECNATRYTAGYILRSLYKKVSRSANPLKSSLLQCLKDKSEGKIDKINDYNYKNF